MYPSLFHLPTELLIRILSYLSHLALLQCRLTHPMLCRIIDDSVLLQYTLELAIAGLEDNPSPACGLVVGDRLRSLKAQERSWRNLDFGKTVTVGVRHKSSSIYDLTGGVFLLGETNDPSHHRTDALNLVRLPSVDDFHTSGHDERGEGSSTGGRSTQMLESWSRIDIKSKLIDVGLAVQEHDLIAVVTYSYASSFLHLRKLHVRCLLFSCPRFPTINPNGVLQLAFDVHLLKLSTGTRHPLASKPVLRISEVPSTAGLCSISIEIVGNVLGILLNFPIPWAEQPSEFYVIDWITGDVLMVRRLSPLC